MQSMQNPIRSWKSFVGDQKYLRTQAQTSPVSAETMIKSSSDVELTRAQATPETMEAGMLGILLATCLSQ
jgi:hypothetical protein